METLVDSVENSGSVVETLFIFVESFVDFCGISVELSTNIVETFGVLKDNFSESSEFRAFFSETIVSEHNHRIFLINSSAFYMVENTRILPSIWPSFP